MAVRLSKVFGGSAETWLTQQAHYDLAQVHADRIKLKRLELTVALSSSESPLFMRGRRGGTVAGRS
jgi:plasmid maintenance system antidote protein VapI